MSLRLTMLSRLVITFLPRSKCLLISCLQSPSAVILESQNIKPDIISTVSASNHKLKYSKNLALILSKMNTIFNFPHHHNNVLCNFLRCFLYFQFFFFLIPKSNQGSYTAFIGSQHFPMGFLYGTSGKESTCQCSRHGFNP